MKKIIVIRGPLGVGKSTIAKILTDDINAEYLSLDQILKDNNLEGSDGIPLENFMKANGIIFELIDESEKTFIIDGCFYYQKQIDDFMKRFKDKAIIFTLVSDIDKCIERDSNRAKPYGEDATRFVHSITTKVKAGIEIDNTNLTIKETADKILERL